MRWNFYKKDCYYRPITNPDTQQGNCNLSELVIQQKVNFTFLQTSFPRSPVRRDSSYSSTAIASVFFYISFGQLLFLYSTYILNEQCIINETKSRICYHLAKSEEIETRRNFHTLSKFVGEKTISTNAFRRTMIFICLDVSDIFRHFIVIKQEASIFFTSWLLICNPVFPTSRTIAIKTVKQSYSVLFILSTQSNSFPMTRTGTRSYSQQFTIKPPLPATSQQKITSSPQFTQSLFISFRVVFHLMVFISLRLFNKKALTN